MENKKRIVKLDEAQIKKAIKHTLLESLMKEVPGMPMMKMNGRRESSNVIDNRGQNISYYDLIRTDMNKVYDLAVYVSFAGQDEQYLQLPNEKGIVKARQNVETAYQKARQVMGSFIKRARINVGSKIGNGINRMRSAVNESGFGETFNNLDIVGYMRRMIISSAGLFVKMTESYILAVQAGKMDPNKAFSDIQNAYKIIMVAISQN